MWGRKGTTLFLPRLKQEITTIAGGHPLLQYFLVGFVKFTKYTQVTLIVTRNEGVRINAQWILWTPALDSDAP